MLQLFRNSTDFRSFSEFLEIKQFKFVEVKITFFKPKYGCSQLNISEILVSIKAKYCNSSHHNSLEGKGGQKVEEGDGNTDQKGEEDQESNRPVFRVHFRTRFSSSFALLSFEGVVVLKFARHHHQHFHQWSRKRCVERLVLKIYEKFLK